MNSLTKSMTFRFLEPLLSFLHAFAFEVKTGIAAILGGSALLADLATEAKGWEEVSLKVILILALVYICKLYLEQQKEHKAELRETWDLHKRESLERERLSKESQEANTRALNELTTLTKEQTDYFKTVTRSIIDERIKNRPTIP